MKKWHYIILGIVAIFIITNPSVSAFKTFRGKASYEGLKRPVNLFVYSIYKDHGAEYVGVFGNFFRVYHEYTSSPIDSDKLRDSALAADSSNHVPTLPKGYTSIGK